MRWLVCGGRNFGALDKHVRGGPEWNRVYKEYRWAKRQLDRLAEQRSSYYEPDDNWLPSDIEIIHGGASGADRIGDEWGAVNWCIVHEYPANWNKYGKSAGYIRNKQMLEEGKPDLVIAFPGGRGTTNMINLARDAKIEVIELIYNE